MFLLNTLNVNAIIPHVDDNHVWIEIDDDTTVISTGTNSLTAGSINRLMKTMRLDDMVYIVYIGHCIYIYYSAWSPNTTFTTVMCIIIFISFTVYLYILFFFVHHAVDKLLLQQSTREQCESYSRGVYHLYTIY